MYELRVGALQWAVGAFCAVTGALMLLIPYQFSGPSYGNMAGLLPWWGTGFLLAGVGLIGVAVLAPRPVLAIPIHILAGALLLGLAASFAGVRGWTGLAIYTPLAFGVLAVPWLAARRSARRDADASPGRPTRDLFSLAMGAGAILNGLQLLLAPAQFDAPTYDAIRPHLAWYGAAFLAAGSWVTACAVSAATPGWIWRLAHLALGGLLLSFCVELPLRRGIWTGVAYYGGLGLAVAALPWLSRPLALIDPASLRTRRAFALAALVGALGAAWLTAPLRTLRRTLATVGEDARPVALPSSSVAEVADLADSFECLRERLAARTTERDRREQELRERTRQQAVVVDLGQMALQCDDLQALLDAAVTRVAETLGVPFAAVWQALDDGGCRLVAGAGWPPGRVGRDGILACPSSVKRAAAGAAAGTDWTLGDPARLAEYGIVGGASVPIALARQVYGALAAYLTEPRELAPGDEQFLQSVANVLAAAIERERAERTRAQLAALVESSHDAIIGIGLDGTITAWNRGSAQLYGYPADEAIGRPKSMLVPPDRLDEHRRLLEALGRGERVEHFETVRLRKDQQAVEVSVSGSPIRDSAGRVTGGAIVAHDISMDRDQQRRNAQGEKLRALGQMAGGVAHDLNQSLALVAGYTDLVRQALAQQSPDLPAVQDMLAIMRQAAYGGGETVRRLLTFARGRPTEEIEQLDMGALLRDVIQLTAPRWSDAAQAEGRPITLELQVDGDTVIQGSPAALRDAFMNLVLNAVDALPNGGEIRLHAQGVGDRVLVTVGDSGVGMPAEVRDRVFEPFFSTKGERGTGLGLAMVFGIVRRHGGQISVESQPGRGTTFLLNFPAAPRAAAPADSPAPRHAAEDEPRDGVATGSGHGGAATRVQAGTATRVQAGTATDVESGPTNGVAAGALNGKPTNGGDEHLRILAVDDEPALANMAAMMARRLGHEADTATSAEDALGRLETATYDVVLSDVGMGTGMNGWELAAEIRRRSPNTRVILATGWGAVIDEGEARARGVEAVLAKPYRPADLRRVLAGGAVAAST